MSWFDQLQQASFRGVPFGVMSADGVFGRRQAIHEYPFRDKPWVEDLGRGTRKIGIVGFLLENDIVYGGGDVIAQREALIGACEKEGAGSLVHPTLGNLNVSLLEVAITERREDGRYFELNFSFIESGEREFPGGATDTTDAVETSADGLDVASAGDFAKIVTPALQSGAAVIRSMSRAVSDWTDQVQSVAFDATGLLSMVSSLPGSSFGRYFGGHRSGFNTSLNATQGSATTEQLIAAGAAARAAISAAVEAVVSAAESGDVAGTSSGAQATIPALVGAMPDPNDGVRLTATLAGYVPSPVVGTSLVASAQKAAVSASGALLRRAALAGLARSAAQYQPWSADDAALLRDRICALIDAEIEVAGDSGDDDSYTALRDLRTQVITDLNARGAALPPLKTFSFGAAIPALVMANRLYRDSGRGDELVVEANPRHPAFMPVNVTALAA